MTTERNDSSPETVASTADTSTPRRRKPRNGNGHARKVAQGDVAPQLSEQAIEGFEVGKAVDAAQTTQSMAIADIMKNAAAAGDIGTIARTLESVLAGASPDDAAVLRKALQQGEPVADRLPVAPDDELADGWRLGGYPYRNLMLRKNYEKQK